MKRKFKLLCFFIAIFMILSVIPSTILAIEEEEACTHPSFILHITSHTPYAGGSCGFNTAKYCTSCGAIFGPISGNNYNPCPGRTTYKGFDVHIGWY